MNARSDDRFPVLAAFEALGRFLEPTPVMGGAMLAIAVVGLPVKIIAFVLLHGRSRDNLAVHVLGDLLGSVGAIVAAGVILATGWTPIDPILSVLVALLVLRAAWYVLREASHIRLEFVAGWIG